jgi:hypothetical protein
MFLGGLIVIIGVIMLLQTMGIIPGSVWSYLWPVAIILVGVSIILKKNKAE